MKFYPWISIFSLSFTSSLLALTYPFQLLFSNSSIAVFTNLKLSSLNKNNFKMHNYWPRCFFCLSLLFNARINFSTGFIEGSYGGIVSILIFESETNFDTSCVLWMLALSSMMINFFISWGGSFFLSFSTLLRKWINFCDVPVPSVPMIQ